MLLSEYKLGDKVRHCVLMRVQKVGVSSTGGVFTKGVLQDSSASLNFISFERRVSEMVKDLSNPCVVVVSADMTLDKYANDGTLQLLVERVELPGEEEDLSHLLPTTPKDIEAYKQKLAQLIEDIRNPWLKELAVGLFSGTVYKLFIKSPAAMRHHHAYIGGLLEHSVDVAGMAKAIALEAGTVNVDLVVVGALIHDIGKIKEISPDIGFEYTTTGRMIGHIALGIMMIDRAIARIKDFPKPLAQEVMHILLSHHGEQDKGSPVPCVTQESLIVHYADEINATLVQFTAAADSGDKSNWQYNKMLGRQIRLRPDEE